MIVVTGAKGFIGSCLIRKLNDEGYKNIVAVDAFNSATKQKNLVGKDIIEQVERSKFFDWLDEVTDQVEFIFHLGARTDTSEFNEALLDELNTSYSKKVWAKCIAYQIPLVYASSAATYGDGQLGYDDDHDVIPNLKPLNPYGVSKNEFDKWVLQQKETPFFWAGLKFFNVYGPNEYHKGRMASVVSHAYQQIVSQGEMKLFRSHHPDFKDGEQQRDFVYVKDVTEVLYFLMHHRKDSAIYNLGSGETRTFLDLVRATFAALEKEENISFIDTPEDIRDKYQYYTQAEMSKLKAIAYDQPFTPLEKGVLDYVRNYLSSGAYY